MVTQGDKGLMCIYMYYFVTVVTVAVRGCTYILAQTSSIMFASL